MQRSAPGAPPSRVQVPAPGPRDRPRLVVVEDEPEVGALYEDLLGEAGYAVTVLESAFGATERVRETQPCAVIVDLALPFRSGIGLLRLLAADPATAAVPVVIVSVVADLLPPTERARAAAVMAKPFELDTLLATLARVVAVVPPSRV